MADFQPFTALRYNPDLAGDPSLLVAPPYDVVSDEDRAELYGRSAYNIARVDYGDERPGDDETNNRYTRAAERLAEWRQEGILVRDPAPRLYVYDQEFMLHGERRRRRAVFGRLRLEEWEKGIVLPHEVTGASAKADRLNLLRATAVHLSPVMAMYRKGAAPAIDDGALGEAVLDARLPGERHVLRPVAAEAARAFTAALADQRLYIADGHHRYETGLNYRNERRAAATSWTGDEPENFILAALVAEDEPGLVVLPTDRLVKLPQPAVDLDAKLSGLFDLQPQKSVEALSEALAAAGEAGPAFGIVADSGKRLLLARPRDLDAVLALTPADRGPAWRRLDVTILHHVLLAALGYEESPDSIDYTEEHAEAAEAVARGDWDAAFLLNPTPVRQVIEVAEEGERMPRKSTFFYPKLGTGVVMLPLD